MIHLLLSLPDSQLKAEIVKVSIIPLLKVTNKMFRGQLRI